MSRLLINESPLQVQPTLAVLIGFNEAVVLQQIHYWLDPKMNKHHHEGKHWVYNTFKEWHEQFPFFSSRTLERIIANLESQNLLYVGYFNKNAWDRTKWYSINYEALNSLESSEKAHTFPSRQNGEMHTDKMAECNPPNCHNGIRQIGGIDSANLAISYIDTEITSETTQKNSIQESHNHNSENSDPIQQAYQVWHRTVGCKTKLNPERLQKLKELLKLKFKNSLERWESFCSSVSQSSFLMGQNTKGWRITLEWVLTPENAQKVLEGYYKTAEERALDVKKQENDNTSCRIQAFFEKCADEQIKSFFLSLRSFLKDHKFLSWFEDVSLVANPGHLRLVFVSNFRAEYVRNNFITEIHQATKASGLTGVVITDASSKMQSFKQAAVLQKQGYSHD